jgi:molybdopterin-containing oxidoreductase family iron-sulfur binding subunit
LYRIRTSGSRDYELSRRQFLELVAASAVVGYASGCSQNPSERILPYTRQPLDVVPGVPARYATSFSVDGYAMGLIAHTREGRPIKIDGHPEHPTSLGATSIFHEASVLQLYDPDRAGAVLQRGRPSSWAALFTALQTATLGAGDGFRIVVEPTSSQLVHDLLDALKRRYPASRVTFYSPLRTEYETQATAELFGKPLTAQYDLKRAECVVFLDSDLLETPYDLRHSRALATVRAPARPSADMARFYAIEAALSVTGTMADHRLARPTQRVATLAAALFDVVARQRATASEGLELDAEERRFITALGRDLLARQQGRTLIVPGARQPKEVHVLAHALNAVLGNIGHAVDFSEPALPAGEGDQSIASLAGELNAGKVELLAILGGNPVYDAPADLEFANAVRRAKNSLYLGVYHNETGRTTEWFGPEQHPYESWRDGCAYDGTRSIAQPLVRPLRAAKSLSEVLAMFAQLPAATDYWRLRAQFGAESGEHIDLARSEAERTTQEEPAVRAHWQEVVAAGFVRGSALALTSVEPRDGAIEIARRVLEARSRPAGLELNFAPSPTVRDGRFANVSWLLELPEPITKLTWDNAALISPATAAQLGLDGHAGFASETHPEVEIAHESRVIRMPLLVEPHHADDAVTVWLGYGRQGAERLARGAGVDAYPLRTTSAREVAPVTITLRTEQAPLAITQRDHDPHGRGLALTATLAHYRAHPDFTEEHKAPLPSLMPETNGTGPQWAMTIDLSTCTGCSACVVACQAENNVLVVGKEQVRRGREMHWLRIDSYSTDRGGVVNQPMLCQHCEKAPCEYVCPVNATVHSPDGLNEMVYNRCVGTRFCSNNCPYKVRRFNWFDWTDKEAANRGSIELQRNPEVSVRARGVMEKCTFCVQRIRNAEITARKERRPIAAGEVETACQQACPSRAITFGSLEHVDSEMVHRRRELRSYAALHETKAQPRVRYLARIENPNPELRS